MAEAQFLVCFGHGDTTPQTSFDGWRDDWDIIVAGDWGGNSRTDLLFYDAVTGRLEFHAPDGRGRMRLLQAHDGFRNVDIICIGNFGGDAGRSDVLLYRRDGTAEVYGTDGHGGMNLLFTEELGRGWSHIVAGQFGGDGHSDLVLYKETTGVAAFRIWKDNRLELTGPQHMWASYSHLIAGRFGGSDDFDDILGYGDGFADFISTQGEGEADVFAEHEDWSVDWTELHPGRFGGTGFTDVVAYSRSTGRGAFFAGDDGDMHLMKGHEWQAGWKKIVVGDFGGKTTYDDLLFYDRVE